jgi:hypothetical protein
MVADLGRITPSGDDSMGGYQGRFIVENGSILSVFGVKLSLELDHDETTIFIDFGGDKLSIGWAVIRLWDTHVIGKRVDDLVRLGCLEESHVGTNHATSFSNSKAKPTSGTSCYSQVNVAFSLFFADFPVDSSSILWMSWIRTWKVHHTWVVGLNLELVEPASVGPGIDAFKVSADGRAGSLTADLDIAIPR